MSSAANKELIRRLWEDVLNGWVAGNYGQTLITNAFYTSDFRGHRSESDLPDDGRPEADGLLGPERIRRQIEAYHRAIPDLHFTIHRLVAEDDQVLCHWSGRGTHSGPGMMGMQPSGKPVAFSGFNLYRIEQGKIAEMWGYWDEIGFLRQIGRSSLPGTAAWDVESRTPPA